MSLGRPERGSVENPDRLFQILTGLYDAIGGVRTSVTILEQRIVTVTDDSVTINIGVGANQAAPLTIEGDPDETSYPASPQPSPGSLARVWVSTPDPSFPNGVDLGALGAGTLQQTVASGVSTPSAFAGTTGSIPFYAAGSQLAQDNANLFWDAAAFKMGIGTTTPAVMLHVHRTHDTLTAFEVSNASTGTSAFTGYFVSNAITPDNTAGYLVMDLYGTNTNFGDGELPRTGHLRLHNASGAPLVIGTHGGAGAVIFRVGDITPAGGTDVAFNTDGSVDVTNLGASGVVYATVTSGKLKIGTPDEVAAAITWPTAPRVLYSSGTSSAPLGDGGFIFDTGGDGAVSINTEVSLDHYNLGTTSASANYERVRARWISNVWHLDNEAGGTGVLRTMQMNGFTTGTLDFSDTVTLSADNGVFLSATGAADTYFVGVGNTELSLFAEPTRASNASAVLDAIVIDMNQVVITGTTGITTAAGFNAVVVRQPIYNTNGAGVSVATATTFVIEGAPVAGTAVTITVPISLWVQAGRTRIDGHFTGAGSGSNLGFFGFNGAAQVTAGAATAGALYTATEQAMLQTVYDMARTYNLMT